MPVRQDSDRDVLGEVCNHVGGEGGGRGGPNLLVAKRVLAAREMDHDGDMLTTVLQSCLSVYACHWLFTEPTQYCAI